MTLKKFNIRIYGLWIRLPGEVLVCDEIRMGKAFTKFPGGGLELGEGISDCLKREWKEETGMDIILRSHFYTNDFLQISAFKNEEQLISMYYFIEAFPETAKPEFILKNKKFDFPKPKENALIFRWMPFSELSSDAFDFPVDRIVGKLLFTQQEEIQQACIRWSR